MLTLVPEEAYRKAIVTDQRGPVRWHVLSSPDAFRHVFSDNMSNYPKAPITQRLLAPYIGQSLFMAEGQDWRAQRQALAPVFRPANLKMMADSMHQVAETTADRLASLGASDAPVQMSFQMRVFAMDVVRHTIFKELAEAVQSLRSPGDIGPDPDDLACYREGLQTDLDRFLQDFGRPGISELLDLPKWMTPWRLFKQAPTAEAQSIIDRLVAARRGSGTIGGDMLDLLLRVKMPDDGRPLSDAEIRDNLMTFVVAGSDTTALTLTWSIYVLTQLPEWAALLRREADSAAAQAGNFADAEAMPLTRAFLDEVLRLFPSAPLLVRKARAYDWIGNSHVRKGDLVFAPIYTLHRHPDVWKKPQLFDPSRFQDAKAKSGHRYLPFGAGPKSCIAAGFALMEAQTALATFVHRLDFRLQPGWNVKPLMMLTLKPDGGLPVLVSRRTKDLPKRRQPTVTMSRTRLRAQSSDAVSV